MCLILSAAQMVAAPALSLSGYITDIKTGDPLIGANVFLQDTQYGSATDELGYYSIAGVPSGSYKVTISFIGYETLEKSIKFDAAKSQTLNFSLAHSAIEIQETTVTGSQRKDKVTEAPAAIETISTRDILRQTTTNLGSYLRGLKGVDFTSSGINNYSISI